MQLGVFSYRMQFRKNWGYEITLITGRSKDQGKEFNSYEIDYSSWFNPSPKWSGNVYGGYARTYNFARDYLAFYSWIYFAVNELHDRQTEYDIAGNLVSDRLKLTDRVGVMKVKYL